MKKVIDLEKERSKRQKIKSLERKIDAIEWEDYQTDADLSLECNARPKVETMFSVPFTRRFEEDREVI